MKQTKKFLLVLPILTFLAAYNAVPENVTVTQGARLDFRWGITSEASTEQTGEFDCCAKLLNFIPIKTVNVSVTPRFCVVPSGEAIGVKVHTDGVLVVGVGDVTEKSGKKCRPAAKAGIETGDRIVSVNGEGISDTSVFSRKINDCDGKAELGIVRGGEMINVNIEAAYSRESDCYKVGLWVKDSTAGIGTLTFYNPENSTFGALGHAICDSDTKTILTVGRGTVNPCRVKGSYKAKNGEPGELFGDFEDKVIGRITENCSIGIYGHAENIPQGGAIPVASRFQVETGSAKVLCDIDGAGTKAYDIEITKISKVPGISNKSFVITVTDPALIQKTGGIIQGMSGSPIIQNDMLVGAVTHVFVNDAKKGYGIFAENMLDMTFKID